MGYVEVLQGLYSFKGLGFLKTRGTILGVPIMRVVAFGDLYWGPPISLNYHMGVPRNNRYKHRNCKKDP